MTLFLVSVVAGAVTVLAPCILPLLPVVLGGSAAESGSRWKPVRIVGFLGLSVFAFTFLLKASTALIGVPESFWKTFAAVIIVALGVSMIFPKVWAKVSLKIPGLHGGGNKLLATGYKNRASWWGDAAVGLALGPIFTTCSPTYFLILATVLPSSFLLGALYVGAYVLGLAIALLAIALVGQRLVDRLGGAANPDGWFKRSLGALLILTALAIATGADKKIETAILDAGYLDVPALEEKIGGWISDIFGAEERPLPRGEAVTVPAAPAPVAASPSTTPAVNFAAPVTKLSRAEIVSLSSALADAGYGTFRAVELVDPAGFVNAEPFSLSDLVGEKVILLDFMTYSCINCQRTFPYLAAWQERYGDHGFTVVGIHTPEFAFEKDVANVRAAAARFGLEFPIVLDNDYGTWRAYANNSWPHKYLVDIHGNVIFDLVGEGAYELTEEKIVAALDERAALLGEEKPPRPLGLSVAGAAPYSRSDETYFGAFRNRAFFGNGEAGDTGSGTYRLPDNNVLEDNRFYLAGEWRVEEEYVTPEAAGASLSFPFSGKGVYLVAEGEGSIGVTVDGAPVPDSLAGEDLFGGKSSVSGSRLYRLLDSELPTSGVLELSPDVGVRLYTFTFG